MYGPGRCHIADPAGKIINTGKYVAKSTALGIFGREAAHCGQRLTWKDFWEGTHDLAPDSLALNDVFPVTPAPIPGTYKFK